MYWGGPSNTPAFRLERRKRVMPGAVYFIGAPVVNAVKIGMTRDQAAQSRLEVAQTYCPVPLVIWSEIPTKYTGYTERRVQIVCENARIHGEWFTVTPLVQRFVGASSEEEILAICDEVQTPISEL